MTQTTKPLFPDSPLKKVVDQSVVVFHYTLTDDQDKVLDSSIGDEPLPYLHGAGNIVAGLEREMTGKGVGDAFSVTVAPEDGYGLLTEQELIEVPRTEFPEDYIFEKGLPVPAEVDDEHMMVFYIDSANDKTVFLSIDHPLAGQNLHFEVEIVGIRESTPEELEHGHPHGIFGTLEHSHD